ncbi:MAG: type II/IV secretion system protein [Vitreoscilla sp.]|nr:type II/IV secretion system protein [Burkholderiales bacterium]MBP6338491.1 type II/IV secretion system protein [Vitreoscilla sp.]MBP6676352.1 type II/IV secretion system protein [Vitreoscilla sp.]
MNTTGHSQPGSSSLDEPANAADLVNGLGLPVAQLVARRPEEADVSVIPFAVGQRRQCISLRRVDGLVEIVMAQPQDAGTRLWIESRVRAAGRPPVAWFVAPAEEIAAFYTRLERELKALDQQLPGLPEDGGGENDPDVITLSLAQISTDESPVVRFVNGTLYDALKAGASDIHLETTPQGLVVRYRMDGVLQAITRLDGKDFADRAISRIKVLADLDISERRIPQDGRLKLRLAARFIDVRVSIMPSLHGEDAVLRILDRYQIASEDTLSLKHLSFGETDGAFIRRMAQLPYGLFLVTGPTGSGKTTTLYAVLSEVNTGLDKIITIEDPVEYQVHNVLQIPVNEAKGLTFARGLRSILRHDPDKIMVGEMRDAETAQIAIQAALTGHQVFATVHANNVFDVIGRLSTMQVDPYNLVSALNGVLAQRLIRQLCTACAAPQRPSAATLQASPLPPEAEGWRFMHAVGCAQCRGTGYKGRRAIAQTLAMDIEIRSLIAERATPVRLREAARARGLRTLRDAALDLVQAGITSLEEANRVTAVEE